MSDKISVTKVSRQIRTICQTIGRESWGCKVSRTGMPSRWKRQETCDVFDLLQNCLRLFSFDGKAGFETDPGSDYPDSVRPEVTVPVPEGTWGREQPDQRLPDRL